MKKVVTFKLDLLSGGVKQEEQDVKVSYISQGEASTFYRQFLAECGYATRIGFKAIDRVRDKEFKYLTLDGKPIRTRFCLWSGDIDGKGRATFWIGDKNYLGLTKIDYGEIIENRLVPTDIKWYGLIVVPKKTFKVGMSVRGQDFIHFLLVPLADMLVELRETKRGYITIRKEHLQKYAFDRMREKFTLSEDDDVYKSDQKD